MSAADGKIGKMQLRAIQALWHVHASRTLGLDPNDRNLRLKFLSNFFQRTITSTNELTFDEAALLIEAFKKSLGQSTRPRSREHARALGREGRRYYADNTATIAGPRELEIIREYRERLLMTDAEFDSWMRGRTGPLKGRAEIRTVGDARQVQWALKGMLKARGLWREKQSS